MHNNSNNVIRYTRLVVVERDLYGLLVVFCVARMHTSVASDLRLLISSSSVDRQTPDSGLTTVLLYGVWNERCVLHRLVYCRRSQILAQ